MLVAACNAEQLGLPRYALIAGSPDGAARAFVRNHPGIDPPTQSIWIAEGDAETRLARLGPDSDWCNTVVWSADGSTVAFLIQDARLITADRASRRIVSEKWLTEWKGEYPPYRAVVGLTLSPDGREARYTDCARSVRYGMAAPPPDASSLRGCVERVAAIR